MPAVDALSIGNKDRVGREQRIAQRRGVSEPTIGSPARTAIAVSTTADICDRGGRNEPILFRQLGDDRRGQHDDVGRRARAQFVGHGADRAELSLDIEAGLCP